MARFLGSNPRSRDRVGDDLAQQADSGIEFLAVEAVTQQRY